MDKVLSLCLCACVRFFSSTLSVSPKCGSAQSRVSHECIGSSCVFGSFGLIFLFVLTITIIDTIVATSAISLFHRSSASFFSFLPFFLCHLCHR